MVPSSTLYLLGKLVNRKRVDITSMGCKLIYVNDLFPVKISKSKSVAQFISSTNGT